MPLRHHFEQNFHVRHRLEQYGAGAYLGYEQACDPDALAGALLGALDRQATPGPSRRTAHAGPPRCWPSSSREIRR